MHQVAEPNSGPPPQVKLSLLGAAVGVKTIYGEVFKGEIFCYDSVVTNTITLREPLSNGSANIRIIRLNQICEVHSHSYPPHNSDLKSLEIELPVPDFSVMEKREGTALEAFRKRQPTLGVDVTREAQDIFDLIHNTHPDCRWNGRTIEVMGVTLSPPYTPESCSGEENAPLERMKEVLQKFGDRRQAEKLKKEERDRLALLTHVHPNALAEVSRISAAPRNGGPTSSGSAAKLPPPPPPDTPKSVSEHQATPLPADLPSSQPPPVIHRPKANKARRN